MGDGRSEADAFRAELERGVRVDPRHGPGRRPPARVDAAASEELVARVVLRAWRSRGVGRSGLGRTVGICGVCVRCGRRQRTQDALLARRWRPGPYGVPGNSRRKRVVLAASACAYRRAHHPRRRRRCPPLCCARASVAAAWCRAALRRSCCSWRRTRPGLCCTSRQHRRCRCLTCVSPT